MASFDTALVCRETGTIAKEVLIDGEFNGFHCIDHPEESVLGEDAFGVWEEQSDYFLLKKVAENYNAVLKQFESHTALFAERRLNILDPGGHFVVVEV